MGDYLATSQTGSSLAFRWSKSPGGLVRSDAERWNSEAAFFDEIASANAEELRLHPNILRRYTGQLRRTYTKEFLFDFLGDLAGKRVLDLGCGEGCNSVLLAKRGGRVTGIDVSPKSIELARARSKANGVEPQCEFICSPIESAISPANSYDVLWINDLLHHTIADLESVLSCIHRWANPHARIVITEPVSFSPFMRRLRAQVPIHTDTTPDERPLEVEELRTILKYFPGLNVQYCHLLTRLDRVILPGLNNYEAASAMRKKIADVIHWLDYVVLAVPGMRHWAGTVMIYGEVSKDMGND